MARKKKVLPPAGHSLVSLTGGDPLRDAGLPFNRVTLDFHGETAAALQVTREQAKEINYAIMYGGLQVPLQDTAGVKTLCGGCIIESMISRQRGSGHLNGLISSAVDTGVVHADHCLVPLARAAEKVVQSG